MKIRFKRLCAEAVIPQKAHPGDAGFDLTAVSRKWDEKTGTWDYKTGIAVEIPAGYVGLVFPRSSVYTTGTVLSNCVGVIDSGYRGDIGAKFYGATNCRKSEPYKQFQRIGQLVIVPIPDVELEEAEKLSETDRGDGAYGSTGL